jgi:hypothetical protein
MQANMTLCFGRRKKQFKLKLREIQISNNNKSEELV